MDDESIVRLYWDRDDRAIAATSERYGRYCKAIARNILVSDEDAEECVNDTYLGAWNSIPPHRPQQLSTFLGKITRNLAFNRYKRNRAQKRGGGETELVLHELADCVSDADSVEEAIDRQELAREISSFVRSLPEVKRNMFVRRYWYGDSVLEAARFCGTSPGGAAKALERMRKSLKAYLEERGFLL